MCLKTSTPIITVYLRGFNLSRGSHTRRRRGKDGRPTLSRSRAPNQAGQAKRKVEKSGSSGIFNSSRTSSTSRSVQETREYPSTVSNLSLYWWLSLLHCTIFSVVIFLFTYCFCYYNFFSFLHKSIAKVRAC